MRFPAWMSTRWRRAAMVPERLPSVAPAPHSTSRVPVEYLPLHHYLERRYASTVVLTFDQMESLLGFALPEPARTVSAWWADDTRPADRHNETWTLAHRSATPNLLARNVAFERLP